MTIRGKLASIGVGPGKTMEMKDLSPEQKAAIVAGMKDGEAQVEKFLASGGGHQWVEAPCAS